uniref:Uncharacterized protein n=1 Tax=Anguilla anguilla TaxID=7936 RepID=A0A0E9VN15_ANGAN
MTMTKGLYYTCSGRDSISMITSKHDNGREDRVWDFSCKQSFDSFSECFWSPYVNWFDEEFTFSCPSNYIISGMESYHKNKYEDRRWKIQVLQSK